MNIPTSLEVSKMLDHSLMILQSSWLRLCPSVQMLSGLRTDGCSRLVHRVHGDARPPKQQSLRRYALIRSAI